LLIADIVYIYIYLN